MSRCLTLLAALVLALGAVSAAGANTTAVNDPYYGKQWGLSQVRAPQAWNTSTGAGAVIAVVDSGVDLDHADLSKKIAGGATFTNCPKNVRPCGNGDWTSNEKNGAGEAHGTHVAGIAAASTNNSTGIAGVAPDAKILAVKVLDATGTGNFADIADGIRWSVDNGADVINLSLGALPGVQALTVTGLIDDTVKAVAYAHSKGVVVVAASGNEASPLCGTPAFDGGALCVAATDRFEAKAWYSNLAVKPGLRAVAAPGGQGALFCGEDILSTVPASATGFCGKSTPGYDAYAGTSMAAPHVAGVAALLSAQGRSMTEVYDVLMGTARKPGTSLRGVYDPAFGFGIVDGAAAVAAPLAGQQETVESGSGGGSGDTSGDTSGDGSGGGGGGKTKPCRGKKC